MWVCFIIPRKINRSNNCLKGLFITLNFAYCGLKLISSQLIVLKFTDNYFSVVRFGAELYLTFFTIFNSEFYINYFTFLETSLNLSC